MRAVWWQYQKKEAPDVEYKALSAISRMPEFVRNMPTYDTLGVTNLVLRSCCKDLSGTKVVHVTHITKLFSRDTLHETETRRPRPIAILDEDPR